MIIIPVKLPKNEIDALHISIYRALGDAVNFEDLTYIDFYNIQSIIKKLHFASYINFEKITSKKKLLTIKWNINEIESYFKLIKYNLPIIWDDQYYSVLHYALIAELDAKIADIKNIKML